MSFVVETHNTNCITMLHSLELL